MKLKKFKLIAKLNNKSFTISGNRIGKQKKWKLDVSNDINLADKYDGSYEVTEKVIEFMLFEVQKLLDYTVCPARVSEYEKDTSVTYTVPYNRLANIVRYSLSLADKVY